MKRNRFQKEPSGNKYVLTDADIHAIDIRPYPFLPWPYIAALKGLSEGTYKDRFTILRHDLEVVDCPPKSFQVQNARYKPFSYALTPKGLKLVAAKYGEKLRHHRLANFWHDMISTLIVASMEIGAKEYQVPFIKWDTIKKHQACKLPDYRRTVEPDWSPIGIGEKPLFFLLEADHGTESFRSKTATSALEQKFKDYIRFFNFKENHELGMKACFVTFAFVNRDRMTTAMQVLREIEGKANFLFTTLPDFTTWENFPEANGWAITTPYMRVGHPDFNIMEELNGRAEARTITGVKATA